MYLNNTRYYYWLIIYFKVKHVILFNSKGLQKARGPWPGPSPFLEGLGHDPQFRPGQARRASPPVGPPISPPLKKIYSRNRKCYINKNIYC